MFCETSRMAPQGCKRFTTASITSAHSKRQPDHAQKPPPPCMQNTDNNHRMNVWTTALAAPHTDHGKGFAKGGVWGGRSMDKLSGMYCHVYCGRAQWITDGHSIEYITPERQHWCSRPFCSAAHKRKTFLQICLFHNFPASIPLFPAGRYLLLRPGRCYMHSTRPSSLSLIEPCTASYHHRLICTTPALYRSYSWPVLPVLLLFNLEEPHISGPISTL